MVDKYGTGADPYTYLNTDILKNKFGIKNQSILDKAELEFTQLAAKAIYFKEPPYDMSYFCSIHLNLLGDLYDWAGKIRTIDISKSETRFCSANFIKSEGNKIFNALAEENYLIDCSDSEFITSLAELYCDINVLHPFRDGNGRAQRILFEHISINCNYNLNLSGISKSEWAEANIQGFYCNYDAMVSVFKKCLTKIPE